MIRSIDGSTDLYLERLRQINTRLERAQSEVSGGKRVESPSDDPDVIANLMQVRADLARLKQGSTNLERVRAEVDSGEKALQSAVKMLDEVRTLGLSATSNVQTAQSRVDLADQLGSILQRMTGLANTQVNGRYIFSGDSDQVPAFGLDLQQNPPWTTYQGTQATRQIMDPTGIAFSVAQDADTIFNNSDPAKNAFQSIENLRQALLANDDQAIKDALTPLAGISDHLNSSLAFYGNTQSRLEEAVNTSSKMQLQLKTEQSSLEDADPAEAIVEMTQLRYNQQAALEVRAKMTKTSLFDYLG